MLNLILIFNYHNNSVLADLLASSSNKPHHVSLFSKAAVVAICFQTNNILLYMVIFFSLKCHQLMELQLVFSMELSY